MKPLSSERFSFGNTVVSAVVDDVPAVVTAGLVVVVTPLFRSDLTLLVDLVLVDLVAEVPAVSEVVSEAVAAEVVVVVSAGVLAEVVSDGMVTKLAVSPCEAL